MTPAEVIEAKVRRRAAPVDAPATVTREQAAEIAKVSTRTIDRWLRDGLFVSHRPIARGSGRVLIEANAFYAFLRGAEAVA
jgi:hypothetical protein